MDGWMRDGGWSARVDTAGLRLVLVAELRLS